MLRPLPLSSSLLIAALMSLSVVGTSGAASLPGSPGAKLASKCQQTIGKANAKFLAARGKRIAACSQGVLKCLQTKPDDAKCLPKASAGCAKQLGAAGTPDALAATLEAAVVKACGALPLEDLLDPAVLGFANAAVACADVGVDPLAGIVDVARCLRLVHARLADQAAGIELPRAAELAAQGGVDAARVPGLPELGGCGACAEPLPAGKAVNACAAGLGKAGAGFLASTRKSLDKCAAAFVKCAQEKPGDAKCTAKAVATCQKVPAGLEKARAKVQTAAAKSCGGVAFGTLEDPTGINLGALTCACQQVGVDPVLGLADYASCLARHHECELAALLPTLVPQLDSLLADAGIALGDLLCAPPTTMAALAQARSAPRPFTPPFGTVHKYVKSAIPAAVKSGFKAPIATRGVAPRVGAPTSSKCTPAPGKSCLFTLPIHKKPFTFKSAERAAGERGIDEPPKVILSVRRADGAFVDDYFELPLGDTSVDGEIQLDVEYADDLASCDFELALTVVEDGVVADYAAIEQTPHVPPGNDRCDAAKGLESLPHFETLDTTAASHLDDERVPSCAASGVSRTVWYELVPEESGMLFIATGGSDFETAVAVSTGGCGGTEVACAAGGVVQTQVTAGIPYLIHVSALGDPPLTSTLYFTAALVPGVVGGPATLSNLVMGTPEVNAAACNFGTLWTAFPMTMNYSDATGNVKSFTAFPIVALHFEPSQRQETAIVPALPAITGDGFNGTISFSACVLFQTDTVVSFKPRLITAGGNLSNELSAALPKPPGAN